MGKNQNMTLEERIELMEKYHSGDPVKKQEAVSTMLDALDNYVYFIVHKHFAGYIGIIEDLAQSGRLAIIEHMADYNPQFKLTTFFNFHIQNALQDVVNHENGESHYYAESKNIIVKTIRELGLDPENIDEQVLAMHLNMTTGRLHSILEKTLNKQKVELIEEDKETSSDYFESPEDAFFKEEKVKEFRKCIDELDEYEQIVLCMHFGFYYPGWNENNKTYKLIEIQKKFDKKGVDINAVNVYRSSRRHIAEALYNNGLIGKRNRYQSAKEEIGLKLKDTDEMEELFDALDAIVPDVVSEYNCE